MGKYHHVTAAFALLFKSTHNKAIRVECPGLALEFTDGLYIGRDPEGLLRYNNADDFKKTSPSGAAVTHHYKVIRKVENGDTMCYIEFRKNSETEPYALFEGNDEFEAVSGAEMNNYSATGTWERLSVSSTLTVIKKSSANQTLTVNVEGQGKIGTWNLPSSILQNAGFNVDGTLYYRKPADINRGVFANYNDDRVVFYENDNTGRDWTAFFIPLESNKQTLQVRPKYTETLTGGSWRG